MKKRLMLTLLAFVTFLSHSMAQELWIPKWEKFVKLTSDGVNLRQAPSTTSQKLMCRNAGNWTDFSWNPKQEDDPQRFEPFHIQKGDILPVLSETSEWYCLYLGYTIFGQLQDDYEVYVMKKFCSEAAPVSVQSSDCGPCELDKVRGSSGYLVGVYLLGSPSRAPYATFGQKVDKSFVMARYDNGMEFINKFCTGESAMDAEFHAEMMKESDIEQFVQSQKSPSYYHIWMRFAGEKQPSLFAINASSYKHPVTKVPFAGKKPLATSNDDDVKVFDVVEQMPQFPGGQQALMQWLGSHYVNDRGSAGRIIATFVIERDGSVSDVKIVKSVNQWADAEFVRVLKAMPKWIPGKQNGKAVRVKYTIPITLKP